MLLVIVLSLFYCAGLMEVWEARGEESVRMSAGRPEKDRNVNRADRYLFVRGNLLPASALLFAKACVMAVILLLHH